MSQSSENRPSYPPVRRVITGHTPEGKSVFLEDAPVKPVPFGPASLFSDLYWTDGFPADNSVEFKDLTKEHQSEYINASTSSFRAADIPPGHFIPLHRTLSLDYGIVVKGTVSLILDDNKKVVLKEGDVVIQRGTIHAWKNEGTEWARMYFILLPANKIKIGNTELDTETNSLER